MEALKAQLLAAATAGGGGDGGGGAGGAAPLSDAAQKAMQTQIDDYNLMLKNSFEEKEKYAQEMQRERQELLCNRCETRIQDFASAL